LRTGRIHPSTIVIHAAQTSSGHPSDLVGADAPRRPALEVRIMSNTTLRRLLRSVSRSCALALCALVLPSMSPAPAAVRTVGNCNDSGAGSLRNAVAIADSGDRIDLAGLACGRIALTSGRIAVPQADLELVGPGALALEIDGNLQDRVFEHTGVGTLHLQRLSVAKGRITSPEAWGGCIFSAGNVALTRVRLHRCVADKTSPFPGELAYGGGVYAHGKVTLTSSSAFYNTSDSIGGAIMADEGVLDHSKLYENRSWRGGGFDAINATIDYSVVRDNRGGRIGGGLFLNCLDPSARCRLTIRNSTLSGNRAHQEAAFSAQGTHRVVIRDSTITGNVANRISVAWLPGPSRQYWGFSRIYNSTIASNHEQPQAGESCAGAVRVDGDALMESTIVSGNTCSLGAGQDISDGGLGLVVGGHNIIGVAGVPIPDDTILTTDPRLAPLANNGGPTPTRRPLADSPALDRGSNVLDCPFDQRGAGFPRVQGPFPEIGAIER
jgi:hypothetical protein